MNQGRSGQRFVQVALETFDRVIGPEVPIWSWTQRVPLAMVPAPSNRIPFAATGRPLDSVLEPFKVLPEDRSGHLDRD